MSFKCFYIVYCKSIVICKKPSKYQNDQMNLLPSIYDFKLVLI